MSMPKMIACPHCDAKAEYVFSHEVICIFCSRKFFFWEAKIYRAKNNFIEETSPALEKKLFEMRMLHELG